MRCSAASFSSARSSASYAASSGPVAPRGFVPAIGWIVTAPPRTVTSASGLAPTIENSARRSRYMYGLGFWRRSIR